MVSRACICACFFFIAAFAGCSSDQRTNSPARPTIDLGPPPPQTAFVSPDPAATQPHALYRLAINRIDHRRDRNLDNTWAMMLAPMGDAVARWNLNGLRIGVISRNQFPDFINGLRPIERSENIAILTPQGRDTTLSPAPRLKRETTIQWTRDDASNVFVTLRAGQPQFLLRTSAAADGRVRVTITPHHFYSIATLLPQSQEEYTRSGKVFDEMAISFDLDKDQILVIGGDPPPMIEPLTTQPSDNTTTQPAATQPTDPGTGEILPMSPVPQASRQPSAPLRLSDILLGSRVLRVELQSVMLITASPE